MTHLKLGMTAAQRFDAEIDEEHMVSSIMLRKKRATDSKIGRAVFEIKADHLCCTDQSRFGL